MRPNQSGPEKNPSAKPETKTPSNCTRGGTQNFTELQNECLRKGIRFEDPEFPANASSLGVPNICSPIRWKRPVDIMYQPEFFSGNFDTFDVQPGEFGKRPLLCAMASLALRPNLFKLVVPENQSFHDRYAGIFHFKFWHYDRWVDVVIDDRLPTSSGRLIFLHSAGYREYWSALLEKAYAKLHGSYAGLKNSRATSVLTDLTGGLSEIYQLSSKPTPKYIEYLRDVLVDAHKKQSIIVCDANPWPTIFRDTSPSEAKVSSRDGCYCITKIDAEVRYVASPSLYLENPWRHGDKLMDAGCNNSVIRYNPSKRNFSDVKDTWIAVNDLPSYCMQMEICHLPVDKQWIKSILYGKWVREMSAGGCRDFLDTFHCNPQYRIEFDQPDKGKETCTFIVSLAQKNHSVAKPADCQFLSIGFFIYRMDNRDQRLNMQFIRENISEASTEYTDRREVTLGGELPPGTYCIIPSTFRPDQEAAFMIRVWSETPHHLAEIEETFKTTKVEEKVSPQPAEIKETLETKKVKEKVSPHPAEIKETLKTKKVEEKVSPQPAEIKETLETKKVEEEVSHHPAEIKETLETTKVEEKLSHHPAEISETLETKKVEEKTEIVEEEKWMTSVILLGKWVRGVSAGGRRDYIDTFCYNPQYRIEFSRPDEGKKTCTFVVSLTQQSHSVAKPTDCQYLPIGISIYRLENREQRLNTDFIRKNIAEAETEYYERRGVLLRVELPPGIYCIIPSTRSLNQEAKFVIKVWSKTPCYLEEKSTTPEIKKVDEKKAISEEENWITSVVLQGKWVREVNAGGCIDFLDTFCHNPQYRIKFDGPDEGKKTCTFIVSLTQLPNGSCPHLSIGFSMYRLDNSDQRLNTDFIRENIAAAKSEYAERQEVTLRVELPPGTYCIVPSTFSPNQEAKFVIKVVSKTPCYLEEKSTTSETKEEEEEVDDEKADIFEEEEWTTSVILQGKWVRGVTAGGSIKFLNTTFSYNPKYSIEFNQPDEGKETCSFIVSLTQKSHSITQPTDSPYWAIGFDIYQLKDRYKRLNAEFMRENIPAAKCKYYYSQGVMLRVELPPGLYCIIPSTSFPNREADFMLHVLSKTPCRLEEIGNSSFVVDQVFKSVHLGIKYNDYDIKKVKRLFFKRWITLINRKKKELPWADFMRILNYTITTVSTEEDPFFPTKTPNEVFTKSVGDAMTSALERAYAGTQLNFTKFSDLWTKIRLWRAAFTLLDPQNKGVLGTFKLREALESVGYNMCTRILNELMQKYGTPIGQMALDNFILCALRLHTLHDSYERRQDNSCGSMSQFFEAEFFPEN